MKVFIYISNNLNLFLYKIRYYKEILKLNNLNISIENQSYYMIYYDCAVRKH
jgi:hypothetical protein